MGADGNSHPVNFLKKPNTRDLVETAIDLRKDKTSTWEALVKKLAALLILLLMPAVAAAQAQPFPVFGIDLTANNTQTTAATGHARFRFNTGTGFIELSLATGAYDAIVSATTAQTMTNKTLTSPAISAPVLSGTATGTYTLAGTPTITAPAISAPVLSGSATGTYTLAGTPTITSPTISGALLTGTSTISLAKPTHITNNSSTPAIAVGNGAQLGTSPAAAMVGGDVGGNFTLTTGTGPTAFSAATAVNLGVITWNVAYTAPPKGIPIHPCSTNAAGLIGTISTYVDQATCTTTACTVKMVGSTAAGTPTLAASTAYQFCYTVIQ